MAENSSAKKWIEAAIAAGGVLVAIASGIIVSEQAAGAQRQQVDINTTDINSIKGTLNDPHKGVIATQAQLMQKASDLEKKVDDNHVDVENHLDRIENKVDLARAGK